MRAHWILTVQTGALALVVGTVLSCSGSEKKSSGDKNAAATGTTTTTPGTDGNDVSSSVSDFYGKAFYTGYDGVTDYSLLLPSFSTYSLAANDVAKIEEVKVTLPEAKVTELIAEAKKNNPNLDENRMKKMFSRTQTTFKITPLKPGRTTLTSKGREGRNNKTWKQANTFALVVNEYTQTQLDAGKARYTTTGGTGTLRACKECHESGAEGAPPHELGRIMEISDADALTWITTGQLGERTASVVHSWSFQNDEQKQGIVAYLRSKQTHDVEQLAALYFQEFLANGGGMPPGPPPGEGGSNTGTSKSN